LLEIGSDDHFISEFSAHDNVKEISIGSVFHNEQIVFVLVHMLGVGDQGDDVIMSESSHDPPLSNVSILGDLSGTWEDFDCAILMTPLNFAFIN